MKNRFYLICTRDTVGSNASFHRFNGQGYHTDIDQAHVYTLVEAQRAWHREIDQPVCADSVDALAVIHVDCQRIPNETVTEKGCTDYVAFRKGNWDGNDVYWLQDGGLPTTDFSKAARYPKVMDRDGLVWMPFHMADAVKRRTFPIALLNARRMVQAAGLRVPEDIKRYRRQRPSSGRTRHNCPVCGKISWQYDPYTFEGCNDRRCEGAR